MLHNTAWVTYLESLTGRYRPSPCLKWASSCSSPAFWGWQRTNVEPAWRCWERCLFWSTPLWNRISEVNTVKTLRRPRVSWRQRVPQHISQRRASIPLTPREKWCEGDECFFLKKKNGKKVSRFPDDVFFRSDSVQLHGQTGSDPFLTIGFLQILTGIITSWILGGQWEYL